MTIEEAISSLQNYGKNIEQIVLDLLLAKGFSANALINQRVELTGQDADGGFFSDYSESWKKKREKSGFQTKFKDFSFTREMWKSIDVSIQGTQSGKVFVVFEPKDQKNKDKMRYLEEQEGKAILDLSEEETNKLAQVINTRLANIINQI